MLKISNKTNRLNTKKVLITVFITMIFIMMGLGIRTQITYNQSLETQIAADEQIMKNIDTISAYINAKHSQTTKNK